MGADWKTLFMVLVAASVFTAAQAAIGLLTTAKERRTLTRRLKESVAETVRLQVESGIDVVNDGELSKTNFTNYVRERIGGIEHRPLKPGDTPPQLIFGRADREPDLLG